VARGATIVALCCLALAACAGGESGGPPAVGDGPGIIASPSASPARSSEPSTPDAAASPDATRPPDGDEAHRSSPSLSPTAPPRATPDATPTARPAAVHPAGVFHFRQVGRESFTLGVGEGRRELPSEARIEVAARDGDAQVRIVYSDERADELVLGRTPEGDVLLRSARSHIQYLGAEHGSRFEPAPAVVVLPASPHPGAAFSGSFDGAVRGDYRGEVVGVRQVPVGGGERSCLEASLELRFVSGEYTGRHHSWRCWDTESGELVWQRVDSEVARDAGTYRQEAELVLR
jgi:hypothetical protein